MEKSQTALHICISDKISLWLNRELVKYVENYYGNEYEIRFEEKPTAPGIYYCAMGEPRIKIDKIDKILQVCCVSDILNRTADRLLTHPETFVEGDLVLSNPDILNILYGQITRFQQMPAIKGVNGITQDFEELNRVHVNIVSKLTDQHAKFNQMLRALFK